MTVAELRKALESLPEDARIIAEGYDQSCLPVIGVERIEQHVAEPLLDSVALRTSHSTTADLYPAFQWGWFTTDTR